MFPVVERWPIPFTIQKETGRVTSSAFPKGVFKTRTWWQFFCFPLIETAVEQPDMARPSPMTCHRNYQKLIPLEASIRPWAPQAIWLTCCAAAMKRTRSMPRLAMVLYSPRKLFSTWEDVHCRWSPVETSRFGPEAWSNRKTSMCPMVPLTFPEVAPWMFRIMFHDFQWMFRWFSTTHGLAEWFTHCFFRWRHLHQLRGILDLVVVAGLPWANQHSNPHSFTIQNWENLEKNIHIFFGVPKCSKSMMVSCRSSLMIDCVQQLLMYSGPSIIPSPIRLFLGFEDVQP